MTLVPRALLSFLLLPGVVAGLIPYLLLDGHPRLGPHPVPGFAIALAGLAILVACVRDFLVAGRGTLAPWDPPRNLVVVGLYRHVRNPMYLGVLSLLLGWAFAFASPVLGAYAACIAAVFHVRVLTYEEPRLGRSFGQPWECYRASVPRWIPRLSGYSPPAPPIPPGSRPA